MQERRPTHDPRAVAPAQDQPQGPPSATEAEVDGTRIALDAPESTLAPAPRAPEHPSPGDLHGFSPEPGTAPSAAGVTATVVRPSPRAGNIAIDIHAGSRAAVSADAPGYAGEHFSTVAPGGSIAVGIDHLGEGTSTAVNTGTPDSAPAQNGHLGSLTPDEQRHSPHRGDAGGEGSFRMAEAHALGLDPTDGERLGRTAADVSLTAHTDRDAAEDGAEPEHEPLRRRSNGHTLGSNFPGTHTHRAARRSPTAASTASPTGVFARLRANLPSSFPGATGATGPRSSVRSSAEAAANSPANLPPISAAAEAAVAPGSHSRLPSLPRAARVPAALAAAWLGTVVAHLLHADLVVLAAIVLGTAALSRYGSTLLDRLMAAVVVLAAGGIAGGLVISYWPWGLDPVAVGGSGLTAIVGVRVLSGRRFRLPGRVPGADVVAVAAGAAALLVAAWPTLHTEYWKRFMYSALLADRVRQFAMFDVVRSGHSYAFAHFDRVSASALPGARSYPSGMQMVYSIVDCFVHGDGAPGAPIDEFNRYYWYTLISFGLLVLAVVWAARRIAGPLALTTHRLPAVFVASGIGAFLATGYFLSYVWQGFDSVVFASVFLVAGMAVALRPPRSVLEHTLLTGSAFLAVVYGHPLLLPHITLILLAALVVYRTRFLKAVKNSRIGIYGHAFGLVALVAVPLLALSGLSIGTRFRTDGFIIALPRHLVVTVAVLALLALANPAARRLPAGRAALAVIAAVGAVQLALGFGGGSSAHYYVEKSLNGFVLMALVGIGSLGSLWPRRNAGADRAPRPWLVQRAEAFSATVVTAAVAVFAVGAFAFSPAYLNWSRYQPGADSTWAELWTGGHTFIADYGHQLKAQQKAGVYSSGRPVIVAASPAGVLNLNMSLFAGAMNRDLHSVSSQVNRSAQLTGLTGLPAHGEWSPQAKAALKVLEHIISSNPTPVLVVVSDKVLQAKLADYAKANPNHRFTVVYIP